MGFEDETEYQQYLGDLAYAELEQSQIEREAIVDEMILFGRATIIESTEPK